MRWRPKLMCKSDKDCTCRFQIQQLSARIEELENIIQDIEQHRINEIGYDDDEDIIINLCRESYGC